MKTSQRTLAALFLVVGGTLVGTSAALAQSRQDFQRNQHSGYGKCTTDEGYGRYGTCDAGGN